MTLDDFNRQLILVLWQGAKDIDQMCKETIEVAAKNVYTKEPGMKKGCR